MKRTFGTALALCLAVFVLSTPAPGGMNPNAKLAVHLKAHPTVCSDIFPLLTQCSQINTTYFPLGDIDAIPVFYDLYEYTEVAMALDWPTAWGSMSWVRCKGDAQIGALVNPGDFVRISWATCQRYWAVGLGYGWLYATTPGCIGPSSLIFPRVTDCAPEPEVDYACRVWSCVGGLYGDDPCVFFSGNQPTTWGTIKSIFGE